MVTECPLRSCASRVTSKAPMLSRPIVVIARTA